MSRPARLNEAGDAPGMTPAGAGIGQPVLRRPAAMA